MVNSDNKIDLFTGKPERSNSCFLHISHTDLDGYACSAIVKNLQILPKEYDLVNINNVPDTEDIIIDRALELWERAKDKYSAMDILITDLGGINCSRLLERLHLTFEEVPISVIIADHHVVNPTPESEKYLFECIDDYTKIYDCAPLLHIIYYTPENIKMSAAMLLLKLYWDSYQAANPEAKYTVSDKIYAHIAQYQRVTEDVSRWDTGDFGNGFGEIDADGNVKVDLIVDISRQSIYNIYFNLFHTPEWKAKSISLIYQDPEFYLKYPYKTLIETAIIKHTKLYQKFEERVEFLPRVCSITVSDRTSQEWIKTYRLNKTGLRIPAYTIVDTEDFHEYPFSMFAKKYLRENTEADLLIAIRAYGGHPNVSLRGNGRVDCAVIAQLNGGGGHYSASGFPIDLTDRTKYKTLGDSCTFTFDDSGNKFSDYIGPNVIPEE